MEASHAGGSQKKATRGNTQLSHVSSSNSGNDNNEKTYNTQRNNSMQHETHTQIQLKHDEAFASHRAPPGPPFSFATGWRLKMQAQQASEQRCPDPRLFSYPSSILSLPLTITCAVAIYNTSLVWQCGRHKSPSYWLSQAHCACTGAVQLRPRQAASAWANLRRHRRVTRNMFGQLARVLTTSTANPNFPTMLHIHMEYNLCCFGAILTSQHAIRFYS